MTKNFMCFCAFLSVVILAACHKSNSGGSGSNSLAGTSWTFAGLSSNGSITGSESLGPASIKVVDLADIISKNNTGTIAFTNDTIASINLGYSIDTTYTSITTITGSAPDTTVTPITGSIGPNTSSTNYQLVGSDSIYFGQNSPFSVSLGTGDTIHINGAHFTISGNTLTLTSTLNQTTNETYSNFTIPALIQVKSTITLTK